MQTGIPIGRPSASSSSKEPFLKRYSVARIGVDTAMHLDKLRFFAIFSYGINET